VTPSYVAVILCVPTVSFDVVKVAVLPLSVPVPKLLNLMIPPPGGGPSIELTTAVKVTACPNVDGFSEDEIVVVVVIPFRSVSSNAVP